ncbi:hypothetical protein R3P38DRAFT_2803052 [Favolaschia claudopus]|uniref:Bacteriophage T5 Orf172 DNA-binding domain-containing protein n=1 Tax=Favolaschia claudopus TaxID=2862362 RepID=A0AAV9ZUS7_9AGAR
MKGRRRGQSRYSARRKRLYSSLRSRSSADAETEDTGYVGGVGSLLKLVDDRKAVIGRRSVGEDSIERGQTRPCALIRLKRVRKHVEKNKEAFQCDTPAERCERECGSENGYVPAGGAPSTDIAANLDPENRGAPESPSRETTQPTSLGPPNVLPRVRESRFFLPSIQGGNREGVGKRVKMEGKGLSSESKPLKLGKSYPPAMLSTSSTIDLVFCVETLLDEFWPSLKRTWAAKTHELHLLTRTYRAQPNRFHSLQFLLMAEGGEVWVRALAQRREDVGEVAAERVEGCGGGGGGGGYRRCRQRAALTRVYHSYRGRPMLLGFSVASYVAASKWRGVGVSDSWVVVQVRRKEEERVVRADRGGHNSRMNWRHLCWNAYGKSKARSVFVVRVVVYGVRVFGVRRYSHPRRDLRGEGGVVLGVERGTENMGKGGGGKEDVVDRVKTRHNKPPHPFPDPLLPHPLVSMARSTRRIRCRIPWFRKHNFLLQCDPYFESRGGIYALEENMVDPITGVWLGTRVKFGSTNNLRRRQREYRFCGRLRWRYLWLSDCIRVTEAIIHCRLRQRGLSVRPFLCTCGRRHREFFIGIVGKFQMRQAVETVLTDTLQPIIRIGYIYDSAKQRRYKR